MLKVEGHPGQKPASGRPGSRGSGDGGSLHVPKSISVSLCVGFTVSWALCDGSRNGVSCTSIFIAQKNEDH